MASVPELSLTNTNGLIPDLIHNGLAFFLVWSGCVHLSNPYFFFATVLRYEIIGPSAAMLLAMVLPFLFFVLAGCLIMRVLLIGALLTTAILFLGFFLAQVFVIANGRNIECGCFHISSMKAGWLTASLDFLLLIAVIVGLRLEIKTGSGVIPGRLSA